MAKQTKQKQQAKQIKVTLVRSVIGIQPKHKDCVRSLGLRRINHTVSVTDAPNIRGILNKIGYLLLVEEM